MSSVFPSSLSECFSAVCIFALIYIRLHQCTQATWIDVTAIRHQSIWNILPLTKPWLSQVHAIDTTWTNELNEQLPCTRAIVPVDCYPRIISDWTVPGASIKISCILQCGMWYTPIQAHVTIMMPLLQTPEPFHLQRSTFQSCCEYLSRDRRAE